VYHYTAATLPAGRVSTYGMVAESIGCPGAARAVGSALRKNILNIPNGVTPRVPCHRVVRRDGGMGGFNGGGCERKADMLKAEGVFVSQDGLISRDVLAQFAATSTAPVGRCGVANSTGAGAIV
jgi:O-6-methylguanine DNA methyltransferase